MKGLVIFAAITVALLAYLLVTFEHRAELVGERVVTVDPRTDQAWTPTIPPTTTTVLRSTTTTTRVVAKARTAPSEPWDAIAECESGGNWADRRGGYEGGLHWLNSTWLRAGGGRFARHAYDATREQQIEIAHAWLARTSWASQWPVCSRRVGVR